MNIEKLIFVIKQQKVMLDSDLAELYGIDNKSLLRQVHRHRKRFPSDFLIECDYDDLKELRKPIWLCKSAKKLESHEERNDILFH